MKYFSNVEAIFYIELLYFALEIINAIGGLLSDTIGEILFYIFDKILGVVMGLAITDLFKKIPTYKNIFISFIKNLLYQNILMTIFRKTTLVLVENTVYKKNPFLTNFKYI